MICTNMCRSRIGHTSRCRQKNGVKFVELYFFLSGRSRTHVDQHYGSFRQTVSARTLRYLKRNISQLPTAQSIQQLILRFEPLERDVARVESYVAHAEAAAELASDVARGK